jgi:hypothetical protein
MKIMTSRITAMAVSGALLAGGFIAIAQSASAAQITAGTPVITLHGEATNATTEGPVITSGSVSDSPMFWGLNVSQGCPSGFQGRSDTFVYQNGVKISNLSTSRNASVQLYGHTGLDGAPIAMDDTYSYPSQNPFAANVGLGDPKFAALVPGAFDIRIYCSALSTSIDLVNDKWFDLPLTLSADSQTWTETAAVPVKVTPTVSLTALKNADTTVTLTATVKNAAATATGAIGSVKFFNGANTVIGTGTVAGGIATFTTPANAVGSYSYTAQFVNASDPAFTDSAVSGSASVTIAGANNPAATLHVVIPAGVGSLSLSGVQTDIDLGTATVNGSLLTASGTLGPVVVTDTRQVGSSAWSLTGNDTDFTSGANSFDGGYLGWTPALVGSANAGTAGAAVLPTPGGAGLKAAAHTLASGGVVVGTPTTTVSAGLNLAVPAQTPAGTYTSTLTITLA